MISNSVPILSQEEENLVVIAGEWLKDNNKQEYIIFQDRLLKLINLGKAVFDYPSIRNTQFLRGIIRNENHLTESLLSFSTSSHLLRIPTKVVALRSFLVAKFHCFSLTSMLIEGNTLLHQSLKNVAFAVICTMMAEDVYFSCLEDPMFSDTTKTRLANDLITLWDSGTDIRSIRHLMALTTLWTARDSAPPSLGTMDGNTELLRISMDMANDWEEFLKDESVNNETRWALEEFLFYLSYEEIIHIRARLRKSGISAINYTELHSFMESKPVYSMADNHDLRAIYDFFVERKEACKLRKRLNASGPLHTLEEIYLKYRIILEAK
jgi:hypothetical protein